MKFKREKPVENVSLSTKHMALRWTLVGLCVLVAVIALAQGLMSLLSAKPGWEEIESLATDTNCSEEFVLNYNFGQSGKNATVEKKRITQIYSDASEKAYWLFTKDEMHETIPNVCYLNAHANETVAVDEALYEAFQMLEESGSRSLYLAPVYAEYDSLIASDNDLQAQNRDPMRSAQASEYIDAVLNFAQDPEHVRLELLGDQQVRLVVSQEYLEFAKDLEIDAFIDFHWMKNAFITDYFADQLIREGFTSGYIGSSDGFNRNLDESGTSYQFNIYDRQKENIYLAATMSYRQPASIVSLRAYPLNAQDDRWRYYVYQDGGIISPFVDEKDGRNKSALENMVVYSYSKSCAETLLEAAPAFIADDLDVTALQRMTRQDIYSIWSQGDAILYNDAALTLSNLYQDESVRYYKVLMN